MKLIFNSIRDEMKNMTEYEALYEETTLKLESLIEEIEEVASGRSVAKLVKIIEDLVKSHEDMQYEAASYKDALSRYITDVLEGEKVKAVDETLPSLINTDGLGYYKLALKDTYALKISRLHKLYKPNKSKIYILLDEEKKEELENYIDELNNRLETKSINIQSEISVIKNELNVIYQTINDLYDFEDADLKRKRRENHTIAKAVAAIATATVVVVVAVVTVEFWGPIVVAIAIDATLTFEISTIFISTTRKLSRIGVAAKNRTGQAWRVVDKVSKMKIGEKSVRKIAGFTLLEDIVKSIPSDTYFSFKEVITDVPLDLLDELIDATVKKNTGSSVKAFGAKQLTKNTVIRTIDDYFDYDTEAYHQINELEKNLETLGVI